MSTAEKVLSALSNFKIKKVKANEYRCNSPYRSGSDSGAFSVTIDNDEHGAYFDHVTHESGSLYDLAQYLNVDLPAPKEVQNTKRAYTNLKDYAVAHGATAEHFQVYGWEFCQHQGRPALQFPTTNGVRYRFLDGKKPAYINPNGYKSCWYGTGESLIARLQRTKTLIICNGEASVVASRQHPDLAAIAQTGGEKDIPDNLVKELKTLLAKMPDVQILIALDCDKTGERVSLQIKTTLESAGFSAVRSINMDLGTGGDLADFYMLHSNGDVLASLKKCRDLKSIFEPVTVQRWSIIHASELDKLPPVQWLDNREIPDKAVTVIYGASGVGKSFYVLDKALTIAQSRPVVYMAGEGVSGYAGRVRAWCKHHGRDVGKMYMCLGAVSFMDSDDLTNFVNAIERICNQPAVVVVDTLARSMLGADENSSRDMGKFIDACEQIKHYFDCAVILVHHTGKAGSAERGSSALRGASEAMIKLTDDDDVILVENSKSKDSKPFSPYYMKLLPVDIETLDADGNSVYPPVMVKAEKAVQTEESELTIKQRQVLETMAMDIFEYGALPSDISSMMPDLVDRTLYKILNALKGFGFVEQTSKRQPYTITYKGFQKIGIDPYANGRMNDTEGDDTAHTAHTAHSELHTDKNRKPVSSSVKSRGMMGMTGSNGRKNGKSTLFHDLSDKDSYYSEGM